MRKSLFAIGLLAVSYSVQAQNVLCHVDTNANMYVSEGTLVYSGGGVQTKGNGLMEVHGNVMVVGTAADALKTIDAGGADKTDGGNIVLKMNDPANYGTSTYGQLYIDGLSQSNITGVVSKEYRTASQGDNSTTPNYFQQVALPFFGKALGSLSTELGKTFNTGRYSNPILKWDNANAVSVHYMNLAPNSTTWDASGYYMLKVNNNDWNPSAPASGNVYTINGKPYAQFAGAVTLQNAGKSNVGPSNTAFGAGGNGLNSYGEKYKTYLDDSFESTLTPWTGTFGQNIYQFGNPFLTNIDLSKIGYTESATGSDGNAVKNIWGVEYNPGTIHTLSTGATYATDSKIVTFIATGDGYAPAVGDVDLVVIKPMQSFKIKLRDNTLQTLDFNTLRRFKGTARAAGTDYNVTAAKMSSKSDKGSVKQLGVIGLDANGNELARTYYVVSPNSITGHQVSTATTAQASAGKNMIVTYEEALGGGYDTNYTNSYQLYINEANEDNFQGKNVMLVNFHQDQIKKYKFEIRENAELIPAGAHQLSSGIGFYYKATNGNLIEAKQGDVINVSGDEASLYYGAPNNATLTNKETKSAAPSRTLVVYNPSISNYIVRFDPKWKKADIEVYDMSGKLVISKKAVDATRDFVIELDGSVKNSYMVRIVSDKGETVNTKILK